MKNLIIGSVMAVGIVVASSALAQKPVNDISSKRHPNLAAAQRLAQTAWEKVSAAQVANEFDMDGHAAKAKDLLDQANQQLKMAAEDANKNHK